MLKLNKYDLRTVVKYIIPLTPVATLRIGGHDSKNVTFHYDRYEDDVYVGETISGMGFIKRLIWHIPGKRFKMIHGGGHCVHYREFGKKIGLFYSKRETCLDSQFQ